MTKLAQPKRPRKLIESEPVRSVKQSRRSTTPPPRPVTAQLERSRSTQLPPMTFSPSLIKRSLLVGSTLLAGALVILTGNLINPGSLLSARDPNAQCQGKVQAQSVISREQLGQLLTVAERDRKAKVRQILKAPYCSLPKVEVRAGVKAEREAYPLAFDPQTRLVILYEGDEYAGYAFDVRR
jgi:hypothetical protein